MTFQNGTLAQQVQRTVREGDPYLAVEIMTRAADPMTVARRYADVTRELYKQRDLPAFVAVSRQGIEYLLSRAAEAAQTDPANADELRGAAKTLAYNLAANTWPGWNDPRIVITAADLAAGMEAARLNLRLAQELKRGAEPMFNAHWMIGAMELARGNTAEALQAYEQARRIAVEAKLRAYELLAAGSMAIAKIAGKQDRSAAERELDGVRQALISEKLTDGKFYADQLETACQVFCRP